MVLVEYTSAHYTPGYFRSYPVFTDYYPQQRYIQFKGNRLELCYGYPILSCTADNILSTRLDRLLTITLN